MNPADPGASVAYQFNNGIATLQCSVTNLPADSGSLPVFHRGDVNDDAIIQLTDAVYLLNWLFKGGPAATCVEAADADDNGQVNLTDAVFLLQYLFLGGGAPPLPGAPGRQTPRSAADPGDAHRGRRGRRATDRQSRANC